METKIKTKAFELGFLFLETALLVLFLSFFPFFKTAFADVLGEPNATVTSELEIGFSAPIVESVNIEFGTISLTANSTKLVNCSAIIVDYDNETDLDTVSAVFFDNTESAYGDSDDNNEHYTNISCVINSSYGDINTVAVSCFYEIQYYANPGTWNCTVDVNDSQDFTGSNSNTSQIQTLLGISLPSSIDYGTVDATRASSENRTNVTNVGNVALNLSLEGYALAPGDGQAMNCTIGNLKNISIMYEKYNLTESNSLDTANLSAFDVNYSNLTTSAVVKTFNLDYRKNDSDYMADAYNTTYWRIYVPTGVGGTCRGNIVFGATIDLGS